MPLDPKTRVWRYMSFGKLVSILQKKQLWLSRVDRLGDRWELTLDVPQWNTVLRRRPTYYDPPRDSRKAAEEHSQRVIQGRRARTFVSCWTASEHESHALWRIYCPSSEGVAIQTTLERLTDSVAPMPVRAVVYGTHGTDGITPDASALVTQKRPMFDYEKEVRVILVKDLKDPEAPEREPEGAGLEWDPEKHLECVWVHPEAQYWFMETVTEEVKRLAPGLRTSEGTPCVWWSKMQSPPLF